MAEVTIEQMFATIGRLTMERDSIQRALVDLQSLYDKNLAELTKSKYAHDKPKDEVSKKDV